MEGMIPPDRARHYLVQLGKGRCFMTRHPAQASGPPLISCKYYICIVLKKQTNRIATDRPSNHANKTVLKTEQETSKRF